jgi:hypothetical protein
VISAEVRQRETFASSEQRRRAADDEADQAAIAVTCQGERAKQ